MTTWAYPVHMHPWFRMPSLKRKDPSDDSESSSGEYHPRSPSPPRTKRRRCDVLERGLAQLDLNAVADGSPTAQGPSISVLNMPPHAGAPAPLPPSYQGPPPWAASSSSTPYAAPASMPAVVLPESVEEPTSPAQDELADVKMKVPSWYEIEKDRTCPARSVCARADAAAGIVVTDLEDSDTEEGDAAEPQPSVALSPALLERLARRQDLPIYARDASSPDLSSALVLFRPPGRPGGAEEEERVELPEPEERFVEIDSDAEEMMDTSPLASPPADDAMDVEPL